MENELVTKASIAWVLLVFRKATNIGSEPYVFVPVCTPGVTIRCLVGWDETDGSIDYNSTEEDKLSFIQDFNELYPRGARVTRKPLI